MNQNTKNKLLPLTLSFAVILLDQITKCLVVKFIPRLTVFADDAVIELFGKYLRLIHVRMQLRSAWALGFPMDLGEFFLHCFRFL